MSSGTRIVVFRVREIIYTLLLLFLAVILIVCLVLMFSGKKSGGANGAGETAGSTGTGGITSAAADSARAAAALGGEEGLPVYTAGIYLASVSLGDSAAEVEVTVDRSRIRAIRLINLTEEAEEAYPLLTSTMEALSEQILEKQNLDGITAPVESRYTSQLLLNAVSEAVETALQP